MAEVSDELIAYTLAQWKRRGIIADAEYARKWLLQQGEPTPQQLDALRREWEERCSGYPRRFRSVRSARWSPIADPHETPSGRMLRIVERIVGWASIAIIVAVATHHLMSQ